MKGVIKKEISKKAVFALHFINFLFCLQGCANGTSDYFSKNGSSFDSTIDIKQQRLEKKDVSMQDSVVQVIDTISKEEALFLKKIVKENDFILLSSKVKRYYTRDNLKIPILNELVYSEEVLEENGYVSMSLKFLGRISSVKISYSYSLGQASVGYGAVTGNSFEDYVHSFYSCGLSSCFLTVFKNQTKFLEKEIPNN